MQNNVIYGINGPVVTVANTRDFSMQEMVYVGQERLVGEVIGISDEHTIIQVYEVTTGLRPGDPVVSTGSSMSVTLGPGIISNIFDGIERPLPVFAQNGNSFIERGSSVDNLDPDRLWDVTVTVSIGDELTGGQIYAQCPETASILHRCLVPGRVVRQSDQGISQRPISHPRYRGHPHRCTGRRTPAHPLSKVAYPSAPPGGQAPQLRPASHHGPAR